MVPKTWLISQTLRRLRFLRGHWSICPLVSNEIRGNAKMLLVMGRETDNDSSKIRLDVRELTVENREPQVLVGKGAKDK
jgi:hypothetical protein